MSLKKFSLALIQMAVKESKADNIRNAAHQINRAAANGVKVVCLPELFNVPSSRRYFDEFAESIPGDTSDMLCKMAKENQVYLIGGSIPESDRGKLYNSCLVYGPDGRMLAKYRKLHLFDIDIPGKISIKESDFFAAGDRLTMFDTPFCRIGLGICYDLRFEEMAQLYAKRGCKLLVYPGASNMTTGPLHWELLQRARAVNNQVYVATASPATNEKASYVAWGHSMLVDPLGKVVASTGAEEDIVIGDVDLEHLESVRNQIPITKHKRNDIYNVVNLKDL